MAQLPPKVPSMSQNWGAPSCWVEEFSSVRRVSHRRSSSDSDCMNGSGNVSCFDDEQLMSMFSDDVSLPPSSSNPSTPSSVDHTQLIDSLPTSAIDPKRVKRILANRQSAQRSRVRKLQYISELERSVTCLQTEVSALSPRVAYLDHHRLILNVDNTAIKQRIAALAQDRIFKDAHQEALKKEIERLRKVYEQQSMKKMNSNSNQSCNSNSNGASRDNMGFTDNEQLLIN